MPANFALPTVLRLFLSIFFIFTPSIHPFSSAYAVQGRWGKGEGVLEPFPAGSLQDFPTYN